MFIVPKILYLLSHHSFARLLVKLYVYKLNALQNKLIKSLLKTLWNVEEKKITITRQRQKVLI
jgi:hypothetical protein